MTREEFGPELMHLYTGWKRDDLTPQQMESYFAVYGRLDLAVWKDVVLRALRLPNGFPFPNQLDRIVDEVETEHQQRRAESVRGRGQGGSYVATLEKATSTMRSHTARFWMTIIRGEVQEGLTTLQVAAALEKQDWPADLRPTIELLKEATDWRSFHEANAPVRDRAPQQARQMTPEQESLRWDLNH